MYKKFNRIKKVSTKPLNLRKWQKLELKKLSIKTVKITKMVIKIVKFEKLSRNNC